MPAIRKFQKGGKINSSSKFQVSLKWGMLIVGCTVIVWLLLAVARFWYWNPAEVRFKISEFRFNESKGMVRMFYRMSHIDTPDKDELWAPLSFGYLGSPIRCHGCNEPYRINHVYFSTDEFNQRSLNTIEPSHFLNAKQVQLSCHTIPYRPKYLEKLISLLPRGIQVDINQFHNQRAKMVHSEWFPIKPEIREAVRRSMDSQD